MQSDSFENFGNNESTHGVGYLGKENSENIDIYYKNWGSGRPVVNGNSAGRRKNVFSS
jgi:hypothetical protein